MSNYVKTTAETIFRQLGGRSGMGFATVTGTRRFVCGETESGPYLQFDLPSLRDYRPTEKVLPNRCRISLIVGEDTYRVHFFRYTPSKVVRKVVDGELTFEFHDEKVVSTLDVKEIYADQLQSLFECHTGLLLDLCRVRFN